MLRDYQQDAVHACWDYWREGKGTSPLVVAPTGSGKSHIIAEIASKVAERKCKVILITHRKELIAQDFEKIIAAGFSDIAIFGASFRQKSFAAVTCAQIQSLAKCADIPKFDLAIIDEAHLVPVSGTGQYQDIIERLKLKNPQLRLLGLTATPYRTKDGMLNDHNDRIFDGIAYEIEIKKLIEQGWLAKPVPFGADTVTEFDIKKLVCHGDDYQIKQQDEETIRLARTITDDIITRTTDRKKVLLFCAGISGCNAIKEQFDRLQIENEIVVGSTPAEQRAAVLQNYKNGGLKFLISCDVLTTGFDAPETDTLALIRATRSPGLYVQMVGRGMRVAKNKSNCLVLDYGKNVERHGPIDNISPAKKNGGTGQTPMKKCFNCFAYIMLSASICPECNMKQPVREKEKFTEKPGKKELLTSEWVDVLDIKYQLHTKEGKPPSVRITYDTAYRQYSEWLMPEHGGYPRQKFNERIRKKFGSNANTVGDCLDECDRWPVPRRISVRKDGDFWRVIQGDYETLEMDPPPPEPEEDPDIEKWRAVF